MDMEYTENWDNWKTDDSGTAYTSAILVAEIRKPPDITQTHSVANAGQDEFQFTCSDK